MVAPIALEQFFPTPLPSPAPGMGMDPHAPTFVASVSKLLKTTLDARRRSDDTLLARVRGETVRGMEVYRLHLVEDEIRYRRDEETVVLGGIAKLLTRLMEKEKIDMAGLDNEAAAKRTQENDELNRLAREKAIVADMERRAKAADREAERVRKEARVRDLGRRVVAPLRSLGTQPATYPGTPGVQRLPTRLDRDIPRRRTFSNGLDIDKAKAVFETCKNVASEHRRRREEESQDFSFTSTFSEDSIMEEDEDSDSDVDNDENEITIHPGNIHLLDAPLILTAPAAPRPGEIDLLFLKKEWLKARTSVDIATHEWECQKAQHAYGALWTSIKTASGPLCEPLTFETFPWPMVTAPGAPYDIEVKDVVEFLFSGAKSFAQRQKALDNALKLWHADNFVRLGVVNHICKSDVELVKTGQMIVFSVLQELAGYNFGRA